MKFTTLEKILGTLCLALIVGFLSKPPEIDYVEHCEKPAETHAILPDLKGSDTTLAWLQGIYPLFNDAYFENKLPQDVEIDLLEHDPNSMATTDCTSSNKNCKIHFNYKYVVAPRNAELTMLHEMCHIPTFDEHVPGASGQVALHGPHWRICMLKLDIQGAFRYILIDGYSPREAQLTVFQ